MSVVNSRFFAGAAQEMSQAQLARISVRFLLVALVALQVLCGLAQAQSSRDYDVRGLIVSPGETVQIFLNQSIEASVPATVEYRDNGGSSGLTTLAEAQVGAFIGEISIAQGQVDSFSYTAPLEEGFDQIIVADLYGRTADRSREMSVNIFVLDREHPESSIFGKLGVFPDQIQVEAIPQQQVFVPSLGTLIGHELVTPHTFDRLKAFVLADGSRAVENLRLRNFIFPLAWRGDDTSQPQQDCRQMLPGETLDAYIKRCVFPRKSPPIKGEKQIDTSDPKPTKPPVHTDTFPVGSTMNGGSTTGSGGISWSPPSATGGVGGSVSVGGSNNWNETSSCTSLADRQEFNWIRTTRQWDGRKWVIIKRELCTQDFYWFTLYCPPRDPFRQGPVPIGAPVCRVLK